MAGEVQHQFNNLAASTTAAVSIVGLQALVADTFALSGNFAFERDATSGGIEALASGAGCRWWRAACALA
ncbi:hypothetical protein LDC_2905 [sediment metagenome]|uniref:Uncharacterized protein n=1 Tax=sediment metagenome TaxID=749907 RepID=D9PMX6_9ZZZZ